MKFLYVVLAISLVGFTRSQPLEDSEVENEEHLFYDDEELQTLTANATVETVDHRFGGGQPATLGSSCAISFFTVESTNRVKDKNGEVQTRVVLQKGSLKNAVLVMNGHFLLTAADLVQNTQKPLVVKQDNNSLVRVSRIIIIDGTNIALLKLCTKVTRVPYCNILPEQMCTTSTCSAIPPSIVSNAFNATGVANARPQTTITQLQGTTVPCTDNLSSSCCFTSSQTLCPGDKGAGVVSGQTVVGIITGNNNCQPQAVYSYTPIQGATTQKLYNGVTRSLDCIKCASLNQSTPEIIRI